MPKKRRYSRIDRGPAVAEAKHANYIADLQSTRRNASLLQRRTASSSRMTPNASGVSILSWVPADAKVARAGIIAKIPLIVRSVPYLEGRTVCKDRRVKDNSRRGRWKDLACLARAGRWEICGIRLHANPRRNAKSSRMCVVRIRRTANVFSKTAISILENS